MKRNSQYCGSGNFESVNKWPPGSGSIFIDISVNYRTNPYFLSKIERNKYNGSYLFDKIFSMATQMSRCDPDLAGPVTSLSLAPRIQESGLRIRGSGWERNFYGSTTNGKQLTSVMAVRIYKKAKTYDGVTEMDKARQN